MEKKIPVIIALILSFMFLYSGYGQSENLEDIFHPATRQDIVGVWERVGGNVDLPELTKYLIIYFSSDGIYREKAVSHPYEELNKSTPNFMAVGGTCSYTINNGDIIVTRLADGAQKLFGSIYFAKDVPEDVAKRQFSEVGFPKKGHLLLISQDRVFTLLKKVADATETEATEKKIQQSIPKAK